MLCLYSPSASNSVSTFKGKQHQTTHRPISRAAITSQSATSIKSEESSHPLSCILLIKSFCLCWSRPLDSIRSIEGASSGYYHGKY